MVRVPGGARWAHVADTSILRAAATSAAGRTVLWSGSLSELEPDGAAAQFCATPMSWSAAAWNTLDAAVQNWVDAGKGPLLLVRTHAAHILSDVPSAVRFANSWGSHGVRLVYDPVSMLTPETAAGPAAADLYWRRIDALAHPDLASGVACVLIANMHVQSGRVRPAPIGAGTLSPDVIRKAISHCTERGLAMAMLETDAELGPGQTET